MSYLTMLVEQQLSVSLLEGHIGFSICLEGQMFKRRPISDEVVFYDWITDSSKAIRALEIHLGHDDALIRTHVPFSKIPYIECDCFVRIWLRCKGNGIEQGKEAFGDIFFFGDDDGRLAVVVGIDEWLSPFQRNRLLSDLRLM